MIKLSVRCLIVAGLVYSLSVHVRARTADAGVTPFVLQTSIERFDATDSSPRTEIWTIATRSDGAHVSREDSVGGRYSGVRIVADPATNHRTTVDVETKSLMTYSLTSKGANRMAVANCGASAGAASKLVLGQNVVNRVKHFTAGDRSFELNEWVAPALACEVLESEQIIEEKGARIGRNVIHAQAISLGDPDPGLFVIPADYVERSPSQFFSEQARLRGTDCPKCMQSSAQKLDAVYANKRP